MGSMIIRSADGLSIMDHGNHPSDQIERVSTFVIIMVLASRRIRSRTVINTLINWYCTYRVVHEPRQAAVILDA
jgi:hypothetical protein